MELIGLTHTTADLQRSRHFYEEILGFEPAATYEPTRWQSYQMQPGVFFAIGEPPGSTEEVSLLVDDLEGLWARIKDQVQVVNPLERTPWGTFRFVISDPDGHLLAFGQKQGAGTSP